MSISPLHAALDRIAIALDRVEAAGQRLSQPIGTSDSELSAKHAALRSEINAVIGTLDHMIDGTGAQS
jgi:hypothetical protein